MKLHAIPLAMFLLPVSIGNGQECDNTRSSEIFITIADGITVDIKVTNMVTTQDTTYSNISASSPHSSGNGEDDCHWVGNSEGGPDSPSVSMYADVLYKFEISGDGASYSFLYMGCDNTETSFYCPLEDTIESYKNDVFVIVGQSSNEVLADGWTSSYGAITDTFEDDDWLWPHDLGTFCDLNTANMWTCSFTQVPGYFFSPQLGGTPTGGTWNHIEEDLLITGSGGSWGQDFSITGDHEIIFPTGYGIVLEAGATVTLKDDITISLPASENITAYGLLTIDGSSGHPVTIQKSSGSDWGKIYISGSGANGSSIDYAEIDGANYCVEVYDADDIEILNSSLTNCSSGLVVSQASGVEMINTTSEDNATSYA